MLRRIKIEKADDMLFWSMLIELAVGIGAFFIASLMPPADVIRTQTMLETLIRLDGVLFGFSGVMVGLFIEKSKPMGQKSFYSCLMFALLAFWSYFLSISFAFINIYIGVQEWVFMPVPLTLFGILCSSIYTLMVFIEERMKLGDFSNKS